MRARWTDDCCGKRDFDGPIISISTRYWPAGGSAMILDEGGFRLHDDGGPPHAVSEIVIDNGEDDPEVLVAKSFKDEDPEVVWRQVADWGQEQARRAAVVLRHEFRADLKNAWRKPLHATDGGCWFCHMDKADLFCKGWDTFYHRECLERERRDNGDNAELGEFS